MSDKEEPKPTPNELRHFEVPGDRDAEFAKRGSLDGGLPPVQPVASADVPAPEGLADPPTPTDPVEGSK